MSGTNTTLILGAAGVVVVAVGLGAYVYTQNQNQPSGVANLPQGGEAVQTQGVSEATTENILEPQPSETEPTLSEAPVADATPTEPKVEVVETTTATKASEAEVAEEPEATEVAILDSGDVEPESPVTELNKSEEVKEDSETVLVESDVEKTTTPTPEVTALAAPTLDLVRIEGSGTGLIAGKADANSIIQIMLGDVNLGEAVTAGDGTFAAFIILPEMDAPQEISLLASKDGQSTPSEDQVLVMPPVDGAAPNVVVADAEGVQVVSQGNVLGGLVEMSKDDEEIEAPVVQAEPEPEPEIDETAPVVVTSLSLDTIRYSEQGDVVLGGRNTGEEFLRVYVNNKPLATQAVPTDGEWQITLNDVAEGVYNLRVDALDTSGAVVARVESPFKREIPEAGSEQKVTIQPGFTLWELAEQKYGDGTQFVQIYAANSDIIKDPDLIYPGQIFSLPTE